MRSTVTSSPSAARNSSSSLRHRPGQELAASQIADSSHGGSIVTYDAGVAWLTSPNYQLDAAIAVGANDDSPDLAFTVGFSGRFGPPARAR